MSQVLTAGTRYDQGKSRDGQPIPTSVVTLLVTPSDAERIALAASEGEVMLTLRNPMDRKPTETTGIRTAALLGQAPPAPVVGRPCRAGRRRPAAEPVAAPAPVVEDLLGRGHPGRQALRRGYPLMSSRIFVCRSSVSCVAARVAPAGRDRRSARRRRPRAEPAGRRRIRVRSSRVCS